MITRSGQTAGRGAGAAGVAALVLTALLAAGLLGWGYRGLAAAEAGVRSRTSTVHGVPVTVWTPRHPRGPVVVVVHGLAGSRQVMRPYALAAARSGFTAVALDLPGHGANRRALTGPAARATDPVIQAELATVVGYARGLGDGRVGLIGHSLGADAVIRYAAGHREVAAVVALAPGTDPPAVAGPTTAAPTISGPTTAAPTGRSATHAPGADLLVLTGEFDVARPVAQRFARSLDDGHGRTGVTYGTPGSGHARRVEVIGGIEHVAILGNGAALRAAQDWLLASLPTAAGPPEPAPVDAGFGPLLAVYAGGGLLLLLLAARLPRRRRTDSERPASGSRPSPTVRAQKGDGELGGERDSDPARLGTAAWWVAAALPAIAGAVAAAALPVERLLPVAVAGRLVALLAVQGCLTLAALRLLDAARRRALAAPPPTRPGGSAADARRAGALVTAGGQLAMVMVGTVLAVGLPTQRYLLQVLPTGPRWWLLAVCTLAAVPAMAGEVALARRPEAPALAAVITTGALPAAWLLAVALAPGPLGFLAIVGPLLVVFLVIFAVVAAVAGRRTGSPTAAVAVRSVSLGWILAVTFPLIG